VTYNYVSEEQRTEHKMQMLGTWLEFAVPLQIVRFESWTASELQARARKAGALIAEKADLLIRSPSKPKHHETRAELLGALAEAVAIMARCPGGIELFGRKFEITERPGG
jgi:hypothetical protein